MGWATYWDNLSAHESVVKNRLGTISHSELHRAINKLLEVPPIFIDEDKVARISTKVTVGKNVLKIRTEMAPAGRRVAHYSALAMSAVGFAITALPFKFLLENATNSPITYGLMLAFLTAIYLLTKHSYYRGVLKQNIKVRKFLQELNNKLK